MIDLDAIKARLARVVGKWPTKGAIAPGAGEFGPKAWAAHGPLRCHATEQGSARGWTQANADADFIATAPGDIAEKIKGSKDAADSFERLSAHLAANKLDLTTEQLTLGEHLKFDPAAEKFIGNPEADKLLTREYRAPFIVPEKV